MLAICQGLVYPQAHVLRESPRTFIIDIGGFTADVLLLRATRPDMQVCRSLEMDVIPMSNDIIGRVSALHDIKIEESPLVIKAGFIQDPKANAIGYHLLASTQLDRAFPQNGWDAGVCG